MQKQLSPATLKFLQCTTLKDLATFFLVTEGVLRGHIYGKSGTKYLTKIIPKKHGGERIIQIPNGAIKKFQRALIPIFNELGYFSHTTHGFRQHRSILTNADPHVKSSEIAVVDIEDFFPSIHFGRIRGLFQSRPFSFNDVVSKHLANLVCCESKLPQGAPTSPVLANLITYGLDRDLYTYCYKHKIAYTRYADDLAFSVKSGKIPESIITKNEEPGKILIHFFAKHKFKINPLKTRLRKRYNHQQKIAGIVVNEKRNVDRKYIDKIRGAIHVWKKYGYQSANTYYQMKYRVHAARKSIPASELKNNLMGRITFLGSVRKTTDPLYRNLLSSVFDLDPTLISRKQKTFISQHRSKLKVTKGLVYVLETDGAQEKNPQGTAFYLDGIGFVTCEHCIADNVYLVCPKTDEKYKISNIRKNRIHDLAIFDVVGLNLRDKSLLFAEEDIELANGENVFTMGFPNYAPGNTLNCTQAKVAQFKTISGIRYPILDGGIIQGKSGGPILNECNKIVGVCQKGGYNGEIDFRMFPINQLTMLSSQLEIVEVKYTDS